jgi:hypothetical protein
MRILLSLPTWTLVRMMQPLLRYKEGHPFQKRVPTLYQWHRGSTDLAKSFDVILWGQVIVLLVIVLAR